MRAVRPADERRRPGALLIRNVKVLDGTGAAPFPGDVLVEGNRISAVSSAGTATAADGAALLDGDGGTLMPGLVEPHAHASFPDAAARDDFTRLPPEEHTLVTMRNAARLLECGYTSCVSAASAKPRLDVVIRNEIAAGRIPGPRYLANGPEITVTGGLGDTNLVHLPYHPTPAFAWVVDGPDEMRKVCRTLVREGVDLLKLNISGDQFTPAARSERTVMAEAEVAAAVEVARNRGVRVCAHARSAESIKLCVRHGIPIIYHANYADEDALDQLESVKDRVFIAPAIGITYNICYAAAEWGLTPERARATGIERELEVSVETIGKMRARGIKVLPGGDYGFAWNPHGTYARDLMHFVDLLGFTPMETLVAATRLGGEVMGMPGELGQVKPGYLADLLLVNGDPLGDIKLLQDPDNILAIVKDGVLHKAPAASPAPAGRRFG